MIDWNAPIYDMEGNQLKFANTYWRVPDDDGDYRLSRVDGGKFDDKISGDAHNEYITVTGDGRHYDNGVLLVRNRAEPANDEIAELRAWRDAAILKHPDLAPVDPDEQAVQKIHRDWEEDNIETTEEAIRAAIAWARANPRTT